MEDDGQLLEVRFAVSVIFRHLNRVLIHFMQAVFNVTFFEGRMAKKAALLYEPRVRAIIIKTNQYLHGAKNGQSGQGLSAE
jgi:hypothetical protein